jgi:osmotically-inducible protein OsmY
VSAVTTQNVFTKVREEVEMKLRQDSLLRDFPIEVIDNNGVVTLQGEVPSEGVSMVAESVAREVEGVINVVNELYVRKPSKI